jgi:hypothetical protein
MFGSIQYTKRLYTIICQIWLNANFKKLLDLMNIEVLHNIHTEYSTTMNLLKLITMCLNKTYSNACVSKHSRHAFPIHNDTKKWKASSLSSFNFVVEYAFRNVKETRGNETEWSKSASHEWWRSYIVAFQLCFLYYITYDYHLHNNFSNNNNFLHLS